MLEGDTSTVTAEERAFLQSNIEKLDKKIDRNEGAYPCFETGGQGNVAATMTDENIQSKD